MKFQASKAGNDRALKKSLKSKTGGSYAEFIGDDGLVVQFLEEPTEWIKYTETYENGKYRPVLEGETPDGRVSKKFLAPAVNLEDGDRVVAVKLPISCARDIVRRYERRGTITDRPWELTKSGSGLDTVYYADPLEPADGVEDLDDFERPDLMRFLEDAYLDAMGTDVDDDDDDDWDDERPVRTKSRPRRRDDERQDRPKTKKKTKKKTKSKKKDEPTKAKERKLPPSEIDDMSVDELKEHLDEIGVDYPSGTRSKAVLEDLLAEHYGEEPF